MILITPQRITLTALTPVFLGPEVDLDPLTAELSVRLRWPTTLSPLAWESASVVRLTVAIIVDGVSHAASVDIAGGIHLRRDGTEAESCGLVYSLTVQWKTDRSGLRRIGEGATTVRGQIHLDWISGVIVTDVMEAKTEEAPAPTAEAHDSVAFSAATSAQTTAQPQTLTFSHTVSGSDPSLFVGVGTSSTAPRLTTSVTFNADSMTELWDFIAQTNYHNSGHQITPPDVVTGNVVITLASSGEDEFIGHAVSMTGVHQTTPTGTVPANASGSSTTASVTVTSETDALVVANLYSGWNGGTPGSNELERTQEIVNADFTGATYTEPGAASVVINPTRTAAGFSNSWLINGVSFKPAAVADILFAQAVL